MRAFERAQTKIEQVVETFDALVRQGTPPEVAADVCARMAGAEQWINDKYSVAIWRDDTKWGPMAHLSIKRLDREPIHDWRELQEIKNLLVGPEHEGVELYPAESRLVDTANQYHLFVLLEAPKFFPFGFTERLVSGESDLPVLPRLKQRERVKP